MPIAQAAEMGLGSDAQPRLIRHDCDRDDEALRKIAWEVQQQITPLVETETIDEKPWAGFPRHQRESLIGDVSGVTHLFENEQGLLAATHRLLKRMGFYARIATADSVGSAWAMAHFGTKDHASVAPNQWCIPPGSAKSVLNDLPIESLRIDVPTAQTLTRLGIERAGELFQLPRDGLAARLGRHLVQRMEQASGEREEPLSVESAPVNDQAVLDLEYPTSDQAILADRIRRLVEKIRTGLAARQRGAIRVTCRLDLSDPPPLFLEIGLFAPTVDEDHISSLLIHRLENIRLASDATRLAISVPLSGPLRTAQKALFSHDPSTHQLSGSSISRLVDSLSGRLGCESVVRVKLLEDPLPENAYRIEPLAGAKQSLLTTKRINDKRSAKGKRSSYQPSPSDSTLRLPSTDDAMRRPLSLLPDPIPLSVAFPMNGFQKTVTTRQLPQRIRLAGVVHTITRHWGPERIETGWWKGPSIGRDYYRIETDRGCWWWIFRNLAKSQSQQAYRWMLHGKFE